MIIDYFPVLMAAGTILLALLTFWAGSSSSNQARRSLSDSIESMARRIAKLEEEDAKKWERINALERKLVKRESLIRELYTGAIAIINQLKQADISPVWDVPKSIETWLEDGDPAMGGVDTRISDLADMIDQHFNDQELRTMCLELGVVYENLEGVNLTGRVQSLVTYFERRGTVDSLVEYCMMERPGVYGWPII